MSERTTVLVIAETTEVGVTIAEVTPIGTVPIGPPGPPGRVQSIVAGSNVTVDDSDPANPVVSASGGGGGGVDSVQAGAGIEVDSLDPSAPVVSVDDDHFGTAAFADTSAFVASNDPRLDRVPDPEGQVDGRMLAVDSDALVFVDAPSGGGIPQGGPLTEPLDTDGMQLFAGDLDTDHARLVLHGEPENTSNYMTAQVGDFPSGAAATIGAFAYGEPDTEEAMFQAFVQSGANIAGLLLTGDQTQAQVSLMVGDGSGSEQVDLAPGDGATVTHDELPYTGPLPVAQSLSTDAPVIRAFATITQTDYDALDPPDENTLYVVEDSGRVYFGADLIANATDPTTVPVTDVSGTSDTIDADDLGKILRYTDSALVTVTLPDGLPVGSQVNLLFWGAAGGAVQDNGTSTVVPEGAVAQYGEVSCVVVATNTWSVAGPVT